jgi:hypothetical protein
MSNDEPESIEPTDQVAHAARPARDDALDGKRNERKRERIAREQREAYAFWKQALNSPVGRRELWRLIATGAGAHCFETRFPCGPAGAPDGNACWHAKGEQDFGLRLYRYWIGVDPAAVCKMHDEHDFQLARRKRDDKDDP